MPLVSVTRFRSRSMRFLPLFMIHANRSIAQVRAADGFLAGAVQCDADLAFWTITVWRDEAAMLAYVASDAHGSAMPHLREWGIEAAVTRWVQDGAELPDWSDAIERLREQGRASKLRHPGPKHADRGFARAGSLVRTRL